MTTPTAKTRSQTVPVAREATLTTLAGTSVAALMTMVESGLPPDPIIEGNSAMTPYEMEEQLKNLDARVNTIGQILPTLATRQDLRDEVARLATKEELRDEVAKLATRDDLRLTTEALQLEMATLATRDDLNVGLEDAKRYTLLLIQATRGEIRQIREEMATKGDLQRLEMATKRDLQQLQRTLSKQIATLRAPGRKKL